MSHLSICYSNTFYYGKIGMNVNDFKFSIWAVSFHVGFADLTFLIKVVYIFVTVKYLSIIGAFTLFFGSRVLCAEASQRAGQLVYSDVGYRLSCGCRIKLINYVTCDWLIIGRISSHYHLHKFLYLPETTCRWKYVSLV